MSEHRQAHEPISAPKSQERADLEPLIERLLDDARFFTTIGNDELARLLNDAVRALGVLLEAHERQASYLQAVEAWQALGNKLMTRTPTGVMFRLGMWWADRPWRLREAPNAGGNGLGPACRDKSR